MIFPWFYNTREYSDNLISVEIDVMCNWLFIGQLDVNCGVEWELIWWGICRMFWELGKFGFLLGEGGGGVLGVVQINTYIQKILKIISNILKNIFKNFTKN